MAQKVFSGLIVLVIGFFAYNYFIKTPNFSNGAIAPDFEAELIDGTAFKLSDMKGQYVLVDFWGSWCAPCRREHPNLVQFYQKYSSEKYIDAAGFEVVSIALERRDDKRARNAIAKDQLNWKNHIVDISRIVLTSNLAQLYSVKEVPAKFLINPQGEIIGNNLSFQEMSKILDERIGG